MTIHECCKDKNKKTPLGLFLQCVYCLNTLNTYINNLSLKPFPYVQQNSHFMHVTRGKKQLEYYLWGYEQKKQPKTTLFFHVWVQLNLNWAFFFLQPNTFSTLSSFFSYKGVIKCVVQHCLLSTMHCLHNLITKNMT